MAGKTLPTVLSQVIEAKAEYDTRLLAQQLGTNYRSLMYWIRGDRPIPAELLPKLCVLLRNFEPLDMLESQAGRVAFKIPDPLQTSEKEFRIISNLMKDVGSALESIANTLADGVVEEIITALSHFRQARRRREAGRTRAWGALRVGR